MWPSWTESIQKRVCRYLLQRYLGQYFQEKLSLDQLNVDVLNGTGNVNDVGLDSQALNQLAEQHTIPLEFIDGHLDGISVTIPWKSIMQKSCEIEVTGLSVTIQPKKRVENAGSSMLDSMWTSMASSMQLAEECLKSEDVGDEPDFSNQEPLSGLEHCAQTIDAILSRVKMCFRDTTIRVEKCRSGSDVGIAMEMHIKLWRYSDESSIDGEQVTSMESAFSRKSIIIEGMTLYTDLFRSSPFSGNCEESNYRSAVEDMEKAPPDNLVMVAKIAGRHEIKLNLKQDDSIGGPQAVIDCNFGSLIGFMSPVQFHIIMELIQEFVNPEPTSLDDPLRKKSYKEKPMDTFDFKRIEKELQEELKPGLYGLSGLNHQRGWSSPVFGEDSDDEFLPLRSSGPCMYQSSSSTNFMNASMMTSMNLSMQQSMSESFASSAKTLPSPIRAHSGHTISSESEISKINLSFASLAVVLLHEDIITLSSAEAALPSSVTEMREVSRNFFQRLGLFGASVKGNKDVADVRSKLNEACTRNHHRIIVAPLKMEAVVTQVDQMSVFSGYVALGYSEIIESLRDSKPLQGTPFPECVEVIVFPQNWEQGVAQSARIEFKNKSYKGSTKTSVRVMLSECQTELDLSACDRISALIKSRLTSYTENHVDQLRFENDPNHSGKGNSQVSVKVACPKFSLNFRFPIPDLRSTDDESRSPYWRRHLRNDSLVLEMKDASFSTVLKSNLDELEFETRCHQARIYYKETQTDIPMLFATALSDDADVDGESLRTQGFDWPRVLVSVYPKKSKTALVEVEEDDDDLMEGLTSGKDKGASPFSTRRVIHETLTADEDNLNASEESVIPGDRQEIQDFIEETSKSTIFKVVLDLRSVEVAFPTKHFFEELYNRISTDLLLWEPSAPSSCTPSSPTRQFRGFQPTQLNAFTMCKSGEMKYGHDSESDSEEELSTPAINSLKPRSSSFNRNLTYGQSELTLNLTVKKAVCSMYTPLQDTTGNIVPGQKGQFTIKVEDGNFFMVSGFKGVTTLGYLCFHSEKATLYHNDFVRGNEEMPSLNSSVVKTIYPSEEGVITNLSGDSSYQDLLSVAVKIERDPTTNVKNFKVALGIKGATLHHRLYLPNRNWFTQLTEFFDVVDTPVAGYTPSSVITELHLHLWGCAIDYRPLYLPYRCFLTMENFGISSNIAALTSTSVLRFISEDAALFLGTKTTSTDLKSDYVCVMDMDLFELSLRLCGNRNVPVPRVDLSASNNVLHIRTCSDSFKALTEVLTYYASEGDLMDPSSIHRDNEPDTMTPNRIKECSSEPALINTEEFIERERRMSMSQTEHLHDLVADAMADEQENGRKHSMKTATQWHHKKPSKQSFEVHYTSAGGFQGEVEDARDSCNATPLPYDEPVCESGGVPIDIPVSDEDDDEEFCILENDPGVGIVPKTGEPEARLLVEEPIRLVENHFSVPVGRMDILKAPKHYPNPVMKYSVHEMSVVWHIFGGEDFDSTVAPKRNRFGDDRGSSETLGGERKKDDLGYASSNDHGDVDIAVDALNPGVVFSKTKAFESAWEAYESPKPERKKYGDASNSWRNKGGKRRKHDVLVELHLNKIKFQHETYPESTEQASRLVVVINNLEIRDRLVSSPFNKMLYLYTTPTRPRQSHANMIVLKAVHLRPDPQLSSIEECCLKLSLLPIRLNIDQDSVLFLYQFFTDQVGKIESDDEDSGTCSTKPPSHTPSMESLPVMTINMQENENGTVSEDEIQPNLLMFGDEQSGYDDSESTCSKDPSIDSTKPTTPVYFRQIIFSPDVPIRLDYQGKRVDMTHGPLAGMLMGLAQLNCSEIRLKRINHRYGILGFDKLALFLLNEWASDIKKNQLPSLLGGVGPMYSFVQLFQGVRDLFWLPIEQYQKDGRIAKGLQRGANAFSTSAALAALELTNRFVKIVQGAAEITYDMVSPGPSVQQKRRNSSKKKKRYAQPGDIREGMTNAYQVVKEGLGDTTQTIVHVAIKEHEQKGMSGAVGGVLRQIPPTVVRPIILMAEATTNVIDGFRSQLEPEFKKEAEEKWKES